MIQQRKKDYLQRLIEELSKKLHQLQEEGRSADDSEKQKLLGECFTFFRENFEVSPVDDFESIIEKVDDFDLLEQYAKLLMTEYDMADTKDNESLNNALSIVEYVENMDKTYSWERTVLREDILHRLEAGI